MMSGLPTLSVYDHRHVLSLDPELIPKLENAAALAMPMVIERSTDEGSALSLLGEIEVSLIDDATIADVHQRFMDIPEATDVITFDHGEIHISVETARRQAEEYFHDLEAEIMLYILHGLLHLAGHEDATESGQQKMDMHQTEILSLVWQG